MRYIEGENRYQPQRMPDLQSSGETQKLTTDPEARIMKSKDGFHPSYNVQTVVDAVSYLIADKGYDNRKDMLDCLKHGILANVSFSTRMAQ